MECVCFLLPLVPQSGLSPFRNDITDELLEWWRESIESVSSSDYTKAETTLLCRSS
jgi:hypothetical protein